MALHYYLYLYGIFTFLEFNSPVFTQQKCFILSLYDTKLFYPVK